MTNGDPAEFQEEAKRRNRAAPLDALKIKRDKAWIVVEGYVGDRKVGFKADQDQFEQMDQAMMQDYLIGIRQRMDEK